jgi:hypothetical protein
MSFAGNAVFGFLQNTVTNDFPCNELYTSPYTNISKNK